MLEHLFGSKTRVKLLKLFFQNPERTFFVRELARELDTQINAVRRELQLLSEAGLVIEAEDTSRSDNYKIGSALRKYYRINQEAELYPELQSLLVKAKVQGENEFLQSLQDKAGDIKLMILTGRFVGDKDAPSDLLIVGDIKERMIARLIESYEKEQNIELRFTLMSEQEFMDRRHMMDRFLFGMFEGKHVKLVNKLGI